MKYTNREWGIGTTGWEKVECMSSMQGYKYSDADKGLQEARTHKKTQENQAFFQEFFLPVTVMWRETKRRLDYKNEQSVRGVHNVSASVRPVSAASIDTDNKARCIN